MSAADTILLALTQHHRREPDPNAAAVDQLAQYDASRRAEALAEDGQAYNGELAMLRGVVATLKAVAQHGDLSDVEKLLREHTIDDADARDAAGVAPFFRPGHTYSKGQDGYKAPEQTWQFRCVAIADHPREDAGRRAFGFMRQGLGPWESAGVREGEYERGWVDITESGRANA
ncbi:hypothetical protein [Streptomyces chartreusis]|uniref:hypothetical protein n=1 Tax=Streptomyces chartreusis TaxID=1969 RepID=UPI0035D81AF2